MAEICLPVTLNFLEFVSILVDGNLDVSAGEMKGTFKTIGNMYFS